MTAPIVHITPREQALMRENERLTQALRISAFTVETQAEQLAALKAQPVQEPAAWVVFNTDGNPEFAAGWRDAAHEHIKDMQDRNPDYLEVAQWVVRPVYAAPVQPAPLTDERITEAAKSLGIGSYQTLAAAFKAGVQFAESTTQAPLTDEQIVDAIEHLYKSRAVAEMAAKVGMDDYRAIEAAVRTGGAG